MQLRKKCYLSALKCAFNRCTLCNPQNAIASFNPFLTFPMKENRFSLFATIALLAASATLLSCQKDDTDIEIIQPLAGDFHGTDNCGPDPMANPGNGKYTVHIYNTADKSKVFIENISALNDYYPAAENPHEKFVVALEAGKFTLPPTTHTYKVYESAGAITSAGTASTAAGRTLDLRTSVTYTAKATGTIEGNILKMKWEILDSHITRRRYVMGNIVDQPVSDGELDYACTFTGDRSYRYPSEGN